jgi:valyl-tRNA synthetase
MLSEWPKADGSKIDDSIETDMGAVKDIVRSVRNIRATLHISPAVPLSAVVVTSVKFGKDQLKYITALGRLEKLDIIHKLEKRIEGAAAAVLPEMSVYVPLKGIVDIAKEVERLYSKVKELDGEIEKIDARINNGKNIPEDVMDEWKGRADEFRRQKELLKEQISSLSA